MTGKDILLVGNRGGSSVGESLERAAANLNLDREFLDSQGAMDGPIVLQKASWRLFGHRPLSLRTFSEKVANACRQSQPRVLLTTGIAPVNAESLAAIGKLGTIRCNFLTDDPWSKSNQSPWFVKALPHYDFVFSPRRLLLQDLQRHTSAKIIDLPFGVDPDLFHPACAADNYTSDVFFAGGADRDRIPYITALHASGLRVGLYGTYWERFPQTHSITRGKIPAKELASAIASAKIGLCLVRRANRDQHCMRTFELPAVGCCLLMEDTEDHRSLFGPDGEAVVYFRDIDEMVAKAHALLANDGERNRLAQSAYSRIASGSHTYQDRLGTILESIG